MTFQDNTQQQQPPPQSANIVDSGNGILVGVDPSQRPRTANEWTGQQPPQQQEPQQPQQRMFSAEEVEAFRQQEKDKLYPRIEEMSNQLKSVLEERQAEQTERQRLAEEAEEARRAKEESEMDLRALLDKRDEEWKARFEETEQRYAADRAIFERERQLIEIQEYTRARVEQEAEYLLPEVRDMVTGNTPDEVDRSIEFLKQRSEIIAANFAAAAQQQQQPFRGGAMPTVPPVGPLEQLPSTQPITQEFLDSMDMDTYKRHREQLLRMTSPTRRQG